jgi:hypothetical protein
LDDEITRRKFRVKRRNNSATIKVKNQTYVTINDKKGIPVLYDKSDTREVKAILEPGDYIVETDGNVESITSISIEIGEHQIE